METCFVCNYSHKGHLHSYECPECGTAYDDQTKVWFGPYTKWDPRSGSPPSFLWYALFAIAVITRLLVGIKYRFLADLIITSITLLFIGCVTFANKKLRRKHELPYVALTPIGLLVSRTGGKVSKTVGWDEICRKVNGNGWTYPFSMNAELKLNVTSNDVKELHQLLVQRCSATPIESPR